jgi:diguanylate cyclase (GGDEF)-like protein
MAPTASMRHAPSMRDRILVVEDEPDVARLLEVTLTSEGFVVELTSNAGGARQAAAARPPELVLLDIGLPGMSGLDLTREFKSDVMTAAIPIILVTAKASLDDELAGLAAGADDYIAKPFDVDELVGRVRTALRRLKQLRGLSPLTGLPGNFDIQRQLETLIAAKASFALVHADLDAFKAYNDRYGFVRGDAAIRATARLLVEALQRVCGRPRFIGHIGGDDFAVITPADAVERYARGVVARFAALAATLHDPDDIARGTMRVAARNCNVQNQPLLSISLGVATTRGRSFRSPAALASVASEMKSAAKATPRSGWRIDRRRDVMSSPTVKVPSTAEKESP